VSLVAQPHLRNQRACRLIAARITWYAVQRPIHERAPHARLCRGPAGESELIELEDDSTKLSPFPLVQCRNVYVLPGVPTLLQTKWRTLKVRLIGQSAWSGQRMTNLLPNEFYISANVRKLGRRTPAVMVLHRAFRHGQDGIKQFRICEMCLLAGTPAAGWRTAASLPCGGAAPQDSRRDGAMTALQCGDASV